MKSTLAVVSVLAASLLWRPGFAAAQETVKAFDQLNTRLQVGNTVRVTDTDGREVQGKVTELHDASITVNSGVRNHVRSRSRPPHSEQVEVRREVRGVGNADWRRDRGGDGRGL